MNCERFYGSDGEDSIAAGFFRKTKQGFFLDIGAMDGLRKSNTYYFEQQGWKGMCIEAHPTYAKLCRKNRPGSINIHAAVSDKIKDSTDFCASPWGASSCLNENFSRKMYAKHHKDPEELSTIQVPMVTVDFVLRLHNIEHVDYVSVDVEGTEDKVIRGFSLEKYKPRLIILEQCFLVDSPKMRQFMENRGYHFSRKIAQNAFYCRSEHAAAQVRGIAQKKPNVTPHPLH